jgi:glutamate racemase
MALGPRYEASSEASFSSVGLPIGVFDSGVGGLTVLAALRRHLPAEDFIYLGDTARTPYGSKPMDMVAGFAFQISGYLHRQPVKALVVACNTATCAALPALQAHFPVPVVGVVAPTVAKALAVPGAGRVGVIATAGSICSGVYQGLIEQTGRPLWAKACPLLAPLVEEGLWADPIADVVVAHYLADAPADLTALILGCTHYPMLRDVIARRLPGVPLVDSATATAETLATTLDSKGLRKAAGAGTVRHIVTGDTAGYDALAARFDFPQAAATGLNVAVLTAHDPRG